VGANRIELEDPLAEALEELEHAADERMRDEDSVEPPPVSAPPPVAEDAGERAEPMPTELRPAPPIAALPERATRRAPAKTGWGTTDLLVALIALVVLAASIVGLLWLFSGS
jgi:hypothetical protein